MKYILITGVIDSGKSTTIQELCKQLLPDETWELEISFDDLKKSKLVDREVESIFNNVFILRINNINILVIAGCPTEIGVRVTELLEICKGHGLTISFAIVAKRFHERKKGFDTLKELNELGVFIHEEMIAKINSPEFKNSKTWIARIRRLKSIIKSNI